MASEFIPLEGYCLYRNSICSNDTTLKSPNNSTGSCSKPPRPNQSRARYQQKSFRETERSVSQKRRFHSISSSRSQQRKKKLIVKQQPTGWYQVSSITRNLSLAPRSNSNEPVAISGVAGDQPPQGKRRNRRRRRTANKWFGQDRFPSPNSLNSTLGLLRELPCARMHYDSFKRIFQILPTRTMKEKKFRLEAARELPFAKYPDDQVRSILDDSWRTRGATSQEKDAETWNSRMEEMMQKISDYDALGQREGDIRTINDASDTSIRTKKDSSRDSSEEEEGGEEDGIEETDDSMVGAPSRTDTPSAKELNLESQTLEEQRHPSAITSLANRPSTTISDDFLSLSESESKKESQLLSVERDQTAKNESLPCADLDRENNTLLHIPLAKYMEVPLIEKDGTRRCSVKPSRSDVVGRKWESGGEGNVVPVSQHSTTQTQSEDHNAPEHAKRDAVESGERIITPQAAVSLFESACVGQTLGVLFCGACGQPAYPAERCEADGQVFHGACFRCNQCGTMLQRGAWNQRGASYYCNPCHRRIALQTLRH